MHIGIDILIVSTVLVGSVIRIRTFSRESVSQTGWFAISVKTAFLLAGSLSNIIMMAVTETMTLSIVTNHEAFLNIFLSLPAYGLCSMTKGWKRLAGVV